MNRYLVCWLPVAAAIITVVACDTPSDDIDFPSALSRIDTFLELGAMAEAQRSIDEAFDRATGRTELLRLLKRQHSISSAIESWVPLATYAEVAHSRYPGYEDFAGIWAYAELRSGQQSRAQHVAREYLASDQWRAIRDEIWVETELSGDPTDQLGDLFPATYRSSMGEHDANRLKQAADRFDDSRLAIDAALIFAGMGEIRRAFSTIEACQWDFPVVAGLLAYDSGNLESASILLQTVGTSGETESVRLVLADIAIAGGNHEAAVSIYRALDLPTTPVSAEIPAAPIVNLLRYYRLIGDHETVFSMADTAIQNHPNVTGVYVEAALSAIDTGDYSMARGFAEQLASAVPGSFESTILVQLIERSAGSALRARTTVRDRFFSNPEDARLGMYAAILSANSRDYGGVEEVVDTYLAGGSESEWTRFFSGLASVATHDYTEALQSFSAIAEAASNQWWAHYNLALVQAASGTFEEARDRFRHASRMAPDDKTRARCIFRIAEILVADGEAGAAKRELSYALDLAPELTEALLLLRQLESSDQ